MSQNGVFMSDTVSSITDPSDWIDGRDGLGSLPWLSVESGNAFSVQSTDEVVGLLVVIGRDAGVLEIQTDRGREKIFAFDQWCHYDRLSGLVFRTPGPLHEVRVCLTDEAVDHSIVRRPLAVSVI